MKYLMIGMLLFASSVSFAGNDSKREKRQAAEKIFDSMTAEELFNSKKFTQNAENIFMPGTSTFFDGKTSLCIDGDTMRTKHLIPKCIEWTSRDDDGNWNKYSRKMDAEGRNGKRNATCSKYTKRILSHPMNYSVLQCVLWQARNSDGDLKTYKTKRAAEGRNDRNARCIEKAMVAKALPTVYRIDFYRKVSSNKTDREYYVGTHTYPIDTCESN